MRGCLPRQVCQPQYYPLGVLQAGSGSPSARVRALIRRRVHLIWRSDRNSRPCSASLGGGF
jgi:hypothetical protein